MKFGRKVLQASIDGRNRIFDLTSHFEDGVHDVISRRKMMPSAESGERCCICSSLAILSIFS